MLSYIGLAKDGRTIISTMPIVDDAISSFGPEEVDLTLGVVRTDGITFWYEDWPEYSEENDASNSEFENLIENAINVI